VILLVTTATSTTGLIRAGGTGPRGTTERGFDGAIFTDNTAFFGTIFGGATEFGGATFADGAGRLPFKETRALSLDGQHVWPPGCCLVPDRWGGYLVARAKRDAAGMNDSGS
jgi:hypothetical protein